jgi:hypothetical protein
MSKSLKALVFFSAFFAVTAFAHSSADVSGMSVVFGGEPEPMLDAERQNLRWRFTDAETNEPITDLEALEAVVTFGGKKYGAFNARGSRRDPGMYQTFHIFSMPGEGEVTLSFKRNGSDEVHTVSFSFTVNSREDYLLPQ